MKTVNNYIAVEPFPERNVKHVALKGGLIGVSQKVELIGLKAIFGDDKGTVSPGDVVFVRADLYANEAYNTVFNVADKSFILLPVSVAVMVDKNDQ